MKKIINTALGLIFTALLFSSCAGTSAIAQVPQPTPVTYQTFYDDLSTYGTWIDYPGYGEVWHPDVDEDFRPYFTDGYWNYTNEGNMWMSDYSWGWAPFHYGRWIYDDTYGWLWIPGYEWSPAWVTWGYVNGFYAWAPLLPAVNVGVSFGNWRPASFYWNVVGQNNLYDRHVMNVAERRENIGNYVNRINVINNFSTTSRHNQYYSKGPDILQYQQTTGRTIQSSSIHEANTSGENKQVGNDLHVYRPAIVHPQPQTSRRIDNVTIRPVMNADDRVSTPHDQQKQNINRLPVHTAPAGSFENRNDGKSSSGRRN